MKDVFDVPNDVYPVGRLDEDSEGLLLLTNDPSMNAEVLSSDWEKEYWVQVEGQPNEEALQQLRDGVKIRVRKKDHMTHPSLVSGLTVVSGIPDRDPPIRYRKEIPDSWISITIREGKNRQVRRMTAAVGYPTLRLIRWRIKNLTIEGMQPGDIKEVSVYL